MVVNRGLVLVLTEMEALVVNEKMVPVILVLVEGERVVVSEVNQMAVASGVSQMAVASGVNQQVVLVGVEVVERTKVVVLEVI